MSISLDGPCMLPDENKVKNIVLFLHGYGANGNDLISLSSFWKDLAADTAFYSPNAPFKCDFGPDSFQWFELMNRDEKEMKQGLKKAGPILNKYIDELLLKHKISEKKLIIVGFSQGTIMALYHMCKRKNSCGGILGYSGMLFDDENYKKSIQSKYPVFLYHGKNDNVISYESSIFAESKLKEYGFDVTCKIQDQLDHGIDENGLIEGKKFLDKILGI